MKSYLFYLILIVLFTSCVSENKQLALVESEISDLKMAEYIKILGSDEFQGRKPSTLGEEKTISYISNVFEFIGLEPGNLNSYLQDVPLVSVSGKITSPLVVRVSNEIITFNPLEDFISFSRRLENEIVLDSSKIVFAGYGIVAPEYNWNDYEGLNVKGKTVIVLVNDPGLDSGNSALFKGDEMTYYGRWTYKYEEAARQGADGVLIIHQDRPAGYPWSVVVNSGSVSKVYPQSDTNYNNRCKIEGWITYNKASKLFSLLGYDLDSLSENAKIKGFRSIELNAKANLKMNNTWDNSISHNVIGLIPGTDLKDEYLFYSAHWDHLGIGKALNGDSIYNGAVDNGTSLAWMFEIAKAFKAMGKSPRRTIVFFSPTAEESGLNGSGYYVDHPIFPIKSTVVNINNDLMLPYGKCKDLMVTGYGQSNLDDILKVEAKRQGRYVVADPNPHTGMYYRSDHFSFARVGVPAIFARGNIDHWEKGQKYMKEKELQWIDNYYHKPSDQYEDWWDLSGVKADAQLLFRVGWYLANTSEWPSWNETSEFKSLR